MEQPRRSFCIDRISQLPDATLISILSHLTIKEAAKTSVLSHRWKFLWLSLPRIDLTEHLGFDSASLADEIPQFNSDKFDHVRWLSAVNHILLARARCPHHHPIIRCWITFNLFTEYKLLLDSFLLFVCNNGIQKLSLENDSTEHYHIPVHIFFCSSLQSLSLDSCAVRRPGKFAGWKAMKKITLVWTSISDSDLYHIMSSCGALEFLHLEKCDGLDKILVCAPKLLNLAVYDDREISISFENTPNIVDFSLSLWCLMRPLDVKRDGYDLYEILMNVPRVQLLHLTCYQRFEEPVPVVKERIWLPECLPSDHLLRNLTTLTLSLCLADADLLPILSCLLRSSPNLNELYIHYDLQGIVSETDGAYWEKHQVTDCIKHCLSYVELHSANLNCVSVCKFVKFILMNACALKRLTVGYSNVSSQPLSVEDDLRRIKWASDHAILKFGPDEE